MHYVRFSIMHPHRGQEHLVRGLLDRLAAFYEQQPGYLGGYRLEHADGSGRVGRLGVWNRHEDADHAAQHDEALAIRSELHLAVDAASHLEYSFAGVPGNVAPSAQAVGGP